jgi:hypothetical protein
MNIRVFRYKMWDPEDDNHPNLAPFFAIREYIEQLNGATIVEEDFMEVDESDLDGLGRIPAA